jgi:hypothetical protein
MEVCRGWAKAVDAAGRGDLTEVQARKILNEILESAGEGPIRAKDSWGLLHSLVRRQKAINHRGYLFSLPLGGLGILEWAREPCR